MSSGAGRVPVRKHRRRGVPPPAVVRISFTLLACRSSYCDCDRSTAATPISILTSSPTSGPLKCRQRLMLLLGNRNVVPRGLIEGARREILVDANVCVLLAPHWPPVPEHQKLGRNFESPDILVALYADIAQHNAIAGFLTLDEADEPQVIAVHPQLIRRGVARPRSNDVHRLPFPHGVADYFPIDVQRVQPARDRCDRCNVHIRGQKQERIDRRSEVDANAVVERRHAIIDLNEPALLGGWKERDAKLARNLDVLVPL